MIKTELLTNHTGFARSIRIKGESKDLLITPSDASDIGIYDLHDISKAPIQKLSFKDGGQVMCFKELTLSTDTVYLLAGYESGHLVLWDLKESKIVHHVKYEDVPVCSVDYDLSTNRGVLSAPTIHKIHVFGINRMSLELQQRDSECIELQHSEGKKVAGVSSLKIRTDKNCLYVGSCDGNVNIFSWKSLRKLVTLRNHRSEITDIAFSETPIDNFKSHLSAIGSLDGSVSLWDIYYKKT